MTYNSLNRIAPYSALLGKCVTIGHQENFLGRKELNRLGLPRRQFKGYIDDTLKDLGATSVDSIDASDYEGASIIHDLNNPIPSRLKGVFDSLIDDGTAEHIYNIPQVFQNYADLLKEGGRMFLFLPASNFCGHGFYQFSPDLFRRTFSKANGFNEVVLLLGHPTFCGGFKWWEPRPVEKTGIRNDVWSSKQIGVHFHAIKFQSLTLSPAQQSDYALFQWKSPREIPVTPKLKQYIVDEWPSVRWTLESIRAIADKPTFGNKSVFTRFL